MQEAKHNYKTLKRMEAWDCYQFSMLIEMKLQATLTGNFLNKSLLRAYPVR
jgi:hypothetical protein